MNLRAYREAAGLSQEELAQRMSDHGFGFSQATIWKIESGNRPIKISEAVALAEALSLRGWNSLTQDPTELGHTIRIERWHRAAHDSYKEIKAAAARYLKAQVNLAFAIREAQDGGAATHLLWNAWLETPPERAVIETRVEEANEDANGQCVDDDVDQVLQALRGLGYEAILDPGQINTEEIK